LLLLLSLAAAEDEKRTRRGREADPGVVRDVGDGPVRGEVTVGEARFGGGRAQACVFRRRAHGRSPLRTQLRDG
jgi:hypothetical protein